MASSLAIASGAYFTSAIVVHAVPAPPFCGLRAKHVLTTTDLADGYYLGWLHSLEQPVVVLVDHTSVRLHYFDVWHDTASAHARARKRPRRRLGPAAAEEALPAAAPLFVSALAEATPFADQPETLRFIAATFFDTVSRPRLAGWLTGFARFVLGSHATLLRPATATAAPLTGVNAALERLRCNLAPSHRHIGEPPHWVGLYRQF